ncbi:hypothetical protein D4Q80_01630 [bacterium]|nr:MAG: hypothetical protein D4Q80_01630 [bacterium]
MKIIITYASAGAGHFKAAEAIAEYFKESSPDLEIKLIDALDYTSPYFKNSYIRGYNLLVNHATWAWAVAFYLTSFKPLLFFINPVHAAINRLNSGKLVNFLIKERPDFVISTHFLPSQITSALKKEHKIDAKLFTVITDFGVHPFWLAEDTDIYAVASDYTSRILNREGVGKNKIIVTGIPIEKKFLHEFNRIELSRKFGLDPDKFTVLIVTGSFGIGPIEQIADSLHKEAQVIAVCARNQKLYRRLNKKNYPELKVFGFVDNIQELMAASDVIITKPGGLTTSEVLAMELPPLFICAIPGQETVNAQYLYAEGIARAATGVEAIKDIILDYKHNPQKILAIKEKIRRIKRPFAAQELYRAVC